MIQRSLLWLAGLSDENVFADLPQDRARHVALGAVLLVPPVLAALFGHSAAGFFTESTPVRIGAAVIWGLIVLAIDRALVISMRSSVSIGNDRSLAHRILRALRTGTFFIFLIGCRLAIAVLVGFVVSQIAVLTLFGPEIQERLASELDERRAPVTGRFEQSVTAIRNQLTRDESALAELRQQLHKLDYELYLEAAGAGASGLPTEGPAWRNLRTAQQRFTQEMERRERDLETQRHRAENQIGKLQKELLDSTRSIEGTHATGYLARVRALARLADQDEEVRGHRILFVMLLLTLELIPLIVKIFILHGSPAEQRIAMAELEQMEALQVRREALQRARQPRIELEVERIRREDATVRLREHLDFERLFAMVRATDRDRPKTRGTDQVEHETSRAS